MTPHLRRGIDNYHGFAVILEIMKLLNEAAQEKIYDNRIIEKNIRIGIVVRKQYQERLQNLPDDESKAEWINIDEIKESKAD
mgnify:CR=1 FL=1